MVAAKPGGGEGEVGGERITLTLDPLHHLRRLLPFHRHHHILYQHYICGRIEFICCVILKTLTGALIATRRHMTISAVIYLWIWLIQMAVSTLNFSLTTTSIVKVHLIWVAIAARQWFVIYQIYRNCLS